MWGSWEQGYRDVSTEGFGPGFRRGGDEEGSPVSHVPPPPPPLQTSVLCRSAVHAGVISDGQGGHVAVTRGRSLTLYESTFANGILSKMCVCGSRGGGIGRD